MCEDVLQGGEAWTDGEHGLVVRGGEEDGGDVGENGGGGDGDVMDESESGGKLAYGEAG